MRLLGVELLRLRSRRAVLFLLVVAVVLPGILLATTAWNTRPVSGAEQERIERLVERESQRPYIQRDLEQCVEKPRRYGIGVNEPDVSTACEQRVLPSAEWFSERSPLDLRRELSGSGLGVMVVLTLLLMLAGTTFAGHDWNSGSMSNQVLFEPRRMRVWLAKGAAVLVTALVMAAVVLAAFWTGLWLVAESRDIVTTGGVVDTITGRVLRGAPLVAAAALGAYALTMFFRSTVATMGMLFAVAILTPLLIGVAGIELRWMPQLNFLAVLNDGTFYYDEELAERCNFGRCGRVPVTLLDGMAYLGTLLAAAGAMSVLAFRRRDVP
ncbi:MAG: hypothetical protein ACRDOM_08290 [Nocardioides sp.]